MTAGICEYHLGATRSEFLGAAPSKLMFIVARDWAKKHGAEILHLGGGLGGREDSLFQFKAGFGAGRHQFFTMRVIHNAEAYESLVEKRDDYTGTDEVADPDRFSLYRALQIGEV